MTTPCTYRPDDPHVEDWADNPVSNTMAWASAMLLPGWCANETHWTTRLAMHMWASCACCLFWRGLVLGMAMGIMTSLLGLGVLHGVWLR